MTSQFASKTKAIAGYYDVIAHGTPTAVDVVINGRTIEAVNHRVMARLIENSPDYFGQNVRLISCSTGALPDGFAKNLANKMNVNVLAPDRLWFPLSDGGYIISDAVTIGGVRYPVMPPTGKIVPFSPGKP